MPAKISKRLIKLLLHTKETTLLSAFCSSRRLIHHMFEVLWVFKISITELIVSEFLYIGYSNIHNRHDIVVSAAHFMLNKSHIAPGLLGLCENQDSEHKTERKIGCSERKHVLTQPPVGFRILNRPTAHSDML